MKALCSRTIFLASAVALVAMLSFNFSALAQKAGAASQSPGPGSSANIKVDIVLASVLDKGGITIPGSSLHSTCSGFKDLGQCVAALHVSNNIGIPFNDLRAKMTGKGAVGLVKAIQGQGGANVNFKNEAKKANKQANADMDAAGLDKAEEQTDPETQARINIYARMGH